MFPCTTHLWMIRRIFPRILLNNFLSRSFSKSFLFERACNCLVKIELRVEQFTDTRRFVGPFPPQSRNLKFKDPRGLTFSGRNTRFKAIFGFGYRRTGSPCKVRCVLLPVLSFSSTFSAAFSSRNPHEPPYIRMYDWSVCVRAHVLGSCRCTVGVRRATCKRIAHEGRDSAVGK